MLNKQLSKFNHIMLGIEKIYEDYAKSKGLTYMSLTVLEIIFHSEIPCTQKVICEMSHYNKQIVNNIVKNFYEKDLITLTEEKTDRRNKRISLTDKGMGYAQTILDPLNKIESEALSELTIEERNALLEMMERCYRGYIKASK